MLDRVLREFGQRRAALALGARLISHHVTQGHATVTAHLLKLDGTGLKSPTLKVASRILAAADHELALRARVDSFRREVGATSTS